MYIDYGTGELPAWLLALRRHAGQLTMSRHRAWRSGFDVAIWPDFDDTLAPESEGWEDAVAVACDLGSTAAASLPPHRTGGALRAGD